MMFLEVLIYQSLFTSVFIRASPEATFKQIRDLIGAYLKVDSNNLLLYGIEKMDFFHDDMMVDGRFVSPKERIVAVVWEQIG